MLPERATPAARLAGRTHYTFRRIRIRPGSMIIKVCCRLFRPSAPMASVSIRFSDGAGISFGNRATTIPWCSSSGKRTRLENPRSAVRIAKVWATAY